MRNMITGMLPPVTKNLLIINVLVWLFGTLMPTAAPVIERYFALHYFTSPAFYPWQLFTYMFLHGGFMHLFFNMFALFMFGGIIERSLGASRFLFYYISCGIFAGLAQMGAFAITISRYMELFTPAESDYIINQGWQLLQQGFNYAEPTAATLNALVNQAMVGASGAVYGVLLAFGMLFPNQPIYLYFAIPIKAKWMVAGYAVIELLYCISGGSTVDNVAHLAHLGGMLLGFVMIIYWRRKGLFNNRWFF